MFKTAGDFLVFAGCVFLICAVISILTISIRTNKLMKNDKSLIDKISFFKSKWNKDNIKMVIVPILSYLVLFVIFSVFQLIPLLIVSSILLIIHYIYINNKLMIYVEGMVNSNDNLE